MATGTDMLVLRRRTALYCRLFRCLSYAELEEVFTDAATYGMTDALDLARAVAEEQGLVESPGIQPIPGQQNQPQPGQNVQTESWMDATVRRLCSAPVLAAITAAQIAYRPLAPVATVLQLYCNGSAALPAVVTQLTDFLSGLPAPRAGSASPQLPAPAVLVAGVAAALTNDERAARASPDVARVMSAVSASDIVRATLASPAALANLPFAGLADSPSDSLAAWCFLALVGTGSRGSVYSLLHPDATAESGTQGTDGVTRASLTDSTRPLTSSEQAAAGLAVLENA